MKKQILVSALVGALAVSSASARSLFGGNREKTKEYNDKMKNSDEKWNSVLYDYQHMRYIYKDASAWWLLLDFKYTG